MREVKLLVVRFQTGRTCVGGPLRQEVRGEWFVRGCACTVICYHIERDLSCAVHGDDFTFCGEEEDFDWIAEKMQEWFEIEVRAVLGPDDKDD